MMMTLTIVLAEITIVLLAVVIVISVRALKRRRSDRDAVNTLVISIKANQPARVEKLAGMLKDTTELSDDDALEKSHELIKKQNKFYQDAINLYFNRNNEILSKLDNRLEDLLDQYQGLLKVSTDESAAVDSEAVGQLSKEISALSKDLEEMRTENATLSQQLKAAEHELDQLGREYVSAFNKPKGDKSKHEDDKSSVDAGEESTETSKNEQVVATETDDGESEPAVAEEAETARTQTAEAVEDEGLILVEEEDTAQVTAEEPVEEATAAPAAAEPQAVSEPTEDEKQTEFDTGDAMIDDDDDQKLFADLGLDELIGEQPARQAADSK
jgi:hypothetical protein